MGKFAEWACDDSLSKVVRKYVQSEMQRLASDASSSGCNKKRRRYIERNREDADRRLYNDYFSDNPTYNSDLFRLRFRMRRELFLRIVHGVKNYDPYFQEKQDGTGRRSLSTLQKCTAAMRMLAYGVAADAVDEYLRIGETTTLKCMRRFVRAVIKVFGEEYMRRPNVADMQRLLQMGHQRSFPGALNDINVLDRSSVFHEVLEGIAPEVNFTINENNYNLGYYLTDGIYPNWATFVKSITLSRGEKNKLFAKKQESARKDVDRGFGVLQARFSIISNPVRLWKKERIGDIMGVCMHNMIVEDERDSYIRQFKYTDDQVGFTVSLPQISRERLIAYEEYIRNHSRICDRPTNHQLQTDLVEHIWNRFGSGENQVEENND